MVDPTTGETVIDPTSPCVASPNVASGGQASVTVSTDGLTIVTATAYDVAGNPSNTEIVEVRVDAETPVVTATAVPAPDVVDGFVNADVLVSLDATDGVSGIDRIEYTIDDAADNQVYNGTFKLTEGITTVTAVA